MAIFSISIAKEFSDTPAGRFKSDGPFSGEVFREKLLHPALVAHEEVEVNLDGALGYGSSFLEEAFGGLVREHGMTNEELRRKLHVKTSRRFYDERIWSYIKDAQVAEQAKKR
jgi:hypothetical protein